MTCDSGDMKMRCEDVLRNEGFAPVRGARLNEEWESPTWPGALVRLYYDETWEYYPGEEDDGHGVHGSGPTELGALLHSEWPGVEG